MVRFADDLETVEEGLEFLRGDLDELHEGVDEDHADVKILCEHAAQEAQAHVRGIDAVFARVHETDLMGQVIHVAGIVVDKDDVTGRVFNGLNGHVEDLLGFAAAFFAVDDLYHGKLPPSK